MSKSLTFAQKVLMNTPNIRLMGALMDGRKTMMELRREGITTVDNMLYFLDIIKKTPDGDYELTEGGMEVAKCMNDFLNAVDKMLPGG